MRSSFALGTSDVTEALWAGNAPPADMPSGGHRKTCRFNLAGICRQSCCTYCHGVGKLTVHEVDYEFPIVENVSRCVLD